MRLITTNKNTAIGLKLGLQIAEEDRVSAVRCLNCAIRPADRRGIIMLRDPNWYARTIELLRLALDAGPNTPNLREYVAKFGTHGYAFGITTDHVAYLVDLNIQLTPVPKAFGNETIRRWKTLNQLLVRAYPSELVASDPLEEEFLGLAALVGFPTLEEIARLVCGAWDEEGILSIDVPKTFGLFRINSKREREPKTFKMGQRIVDLSHKLFIMKAFLPESLRQLIESLDRRMSMPLIAGIETPHVTAFERIEFLRNGWLHGRRFIGSEAWLITFMIALLYFGPKPVSE